MTWLYKITLYGKVRVKNEIFLNIKMKVMNPLPSSFFFLSLFLFSRLSLLETPATPFSWQSSCTPLLPTCDPTRFAPQKIITPFRGLRMNAVLIRYTRKVKYKRAKRSQRDVAARLADRPTG